MYRRVLLNCMRRKQTKPTSINDNNRYIKSEFDFMSLASDGNLVNIVIARREKVTTVFTFLNREANSTAVNITALSDIVPLNALSLPAPST